MEVTRLNGVRIMLIPKPFASGGEGEVFATNMPGAGNDKYCVKIFYPQYRTKEKESKILFMSKNQPTSLSGPRHQLCWPVEAIYQQGNFVGFIMPKARAGSKTLVELTNYKLSKNLPQKWHQQFDRTQNTGIENRIKICQNIALAIHSIHQSGNYSIVDLKPPNILVDETGFVSVLDTDSFQISRAGKKIHTARVSTKGYEPPEGKWLFPTKHIVPTNWDIFSMSVIFYEVFTGINPYTFTNFTPPYNKNHTIEDNILCNLYVHGAGRQFFPPGAKLPPPHEYLLKLPAPIQNLFSKSFEPVQQNINPDRPTAETWGITLFSVADSSIVVPAYQPPPKSPPKPPPSSSNNTSASQSGSIGLGKQKTNWVIPIAIILLIVAVIIFILVSQKKSTIYHPDPDPIEIVNFENKKSTTESQNSTNKIAQPSVATNDTVKENISHETVVISESRARSILLAYYGFATNRESEALLDMFAENVNTFFSISYPSKAQINNSFNDYWAKIRTIRNSVIESSIQITRYESGGVKIYYDVDYAGEGVQSGKLTERIVSSVLEINKSGEITAIYEAANTK
jgi:hypothetical protein